MSDIPVTFRVGGDSSGFVRAVAQAKGAAEQASRSIFKSFEFRDIGRTLATALGFNLQNLSESLVKPFKESAESAERIAKYSEEAANATERLLSARQTDLQQLAKMEERFARLLGSKPDGGRGGFFEELLRPLMAGGGLFGGIAAFLDTSADRRAEAEAKRARDLAVQQEQIAAKRAAIEKKAYDERLKSLLETQAAAEKEQEAAQALAQFRRQEEIAMMPLAERLRTLRDEQAKIEAEIADYMAAQREGIVLNESGNKRLLELEKSRSEVAKQIADSTEDASKAARELATRYFAAADAAAATRASLARAKGDAISASLGELAAGEGTQTQRARALEVQRLEAQARRQNLTGFADLAAASQQRALDIRASLVGLRSDERNPFEAQLAELKRQTEELAKISESLTTTAIR